MYDLFNIFINLLLSLIIGLCIYKVLRFKCCPYKLAFIIVVIFILSYTYILTDERMNSVQFYKEAFTTNINKKIPSLDVDKNTFKVNEKNYYGTEIPIMGPLDGLTWDEVIRRINYLKVKVQYPYKPMTYTDFKTSMDQLIGKDMSGLLKYTKINTPENKQELSRWYPDNTLNQINARDCTNYEPGHPYSCIQDLKHQTKNLLPQDLNNKETFISSGVSNSTYKLLQNNKTMPTIFKNASKITSNELEQVINNNDSLCRNCKVGVCSKGICGSKLVEKGNNNILDVEGYVKSYLDDNIEL
jgi:hypothetical protein